MKKVSLSKIAQETGVSIGTVSRVLSGKAGQCRICKSTVEKVMAAARSLNYSPVHIEKNLSIKKNHLIGLVIPSLRNQYFADIASVVISETEKYGYSVMIFDSMEDEQVFRKAVSTLVEKKVDGMILVPCGDNSMWLEQIDKTLIPIVLVDRYYEDTTLSYVTTNNFKGGVIAVNRLVESGHRDIACIQGVPSMPNKERVQGYISGMVAAGLQDHINVIGNDFTIQNGYLSTKQLLKKDSGSKRPTAIFTLSNTIMLGSLTAIREAGLKVPQDISLISFDNYMYLDYMDPPITRVDQPISDICTLAVITLIEKIDGKRTSETNILLVPKLVEGRSVTVCPEIPKK